MNDEESTEHYSFECSSHTWVVVAVVRDVIDQSLGLSVYTLEVSTPDNVDKSFDFGSSGRLSRGHTVLAQGMLLYGKHLRDEAGQRFFRVRIQARQPVSRTQRRFEQRPTARRTLKRPRLPSGSTEKIHNGAYVVMPSEEPLYRELTERLPPRPTSLIDDDSQSTMMWSLRVSGTERMKLDEMERLHLMECKLRPTTVSTNDTCSTTPYRSSQLFDTEEDQDESLLRELTKVFYERDRAIFLVLSAGFPHSMIPEFSTPLMFWTKILEEVRNGMLPDGIQSVSRCASRLYPSNPVFVRWALPSYGAVAQ